MPPATTASNEAKLLLAMKEIDYIRRDVEENKREFEADLKRVKDEADAEIRRVKDEAEIEIRRVREQSDADTHADRARIKALEDEHSKQLKWGVATLGSAVLAMGYWIFDKVIGGHIR